MTILLGTHRQDLEITKPPVRMIFFLAYFWIHHDTYDHHPQYFDQSRMKYGGFRSHGCTP